MSSKKNLKNIVLATMLGSTVVLAPPKTEAKYYVVPDIYGQKITKEYSGKMHEDEIYSMIDFTMAVLEVPKYADRKYQRAIVKVESADKPNATSHAGARGLRQNTPIAWTQVRAPNFEKLSYNPQASITVGIKYTNHLDEFLSEYHTQWDKLSDNEKRDLVAAAYNGGPTRLRNNNWDILKMPLETRNYVKKINKFYHSD